MASLPQYKVCAWLDDVHGTVVELSWAWRVVKITKLVKRNNPAFRSQGRVEDRADVQYKHKKRLNTLELRIVRENNGDSLTT